MQPFHDLFLDFWLCTMLWATDSYTKTELTRCRFGRWACSWQATPCSPTQRSSTSSHPGISRHIYFLFCKGSFPMPALTLLKEFTLNREWTPGARGRGCKQKKHFGNIFQSIQYLLFSAFKIACHTCNRRHSIRNRFIPRFNFWRQDLRLHCQ